MKDLNWYNQKTAELKAVKSEIHAFQMASNKAYRERFMCMLIAISTSTSIWDYVQKIPPIRYNFKAK
jgi:hypothetical protein